MPHKLLLADDSITIQRVIELTFAGEDIQVVAVGDGEQAIARIPHEHPDVVLADIAMPKRSGYEVCAFVKERSDLAHVPVLLLAGAFEPLDEARAQQVGCDGVLVKPFEPHQVIARVRDVLSTIRQPEGTTRERPAVVARSHTVTVPPAAPERPAAEPPTRSESTPVRQPVTLAIDRELDTYFERLDAAFASLAHGPAAAPQPVRPPQQDDVDDSLDEEELPTIEDLLGAAPAGTFVLDEPLAGAHVAPPPPEPPDLTPTLTASARPAGVDARAALQPERENVIADAFGALLAGSREAAGAVDPRSPVTGRLSPEAREALVEELTRRVLERLAPEAVRAIVADIVSEVAERLARESFQRRRGD